MGFKFENLVIWKRAMQLGEDVNGFSKEFPKHEKWNLSTQIMRAVDSIALNISEGSIGQSKPEFKRFMGYAIRSLAEVVTCLHKAKHRDYVSASEFHKLYQDSYHLMNMMITFKNKI